jgi:hypothetical protein
MYVVATGLADPDYLALNAACKHTGLPLQSAAATAAADFRDDLLAVFFGSLSAPLEPTQVRQHGAYPVLVQQGISAVAMMGAMGDGFTFVLASPLRTERLTAFLDYLMRVAAPPRARIVTLGDDGTLASPAAAVTLAPHEAAVLRKLAEHTGEIVAQEELRSQTTETDLLTVIAALRGKLSEIGSGAQILKVPHAGFRLAGTVRRQ